MIVHLFTSDKFAEPYIKFINKNFEIQNHRFYIIGDEKYIKDKNIKNIIFFKRNISEILRLLKDLNKSYKVMVHGLFYNDVVRILFIQPWILKKCTWFIWGGDLYYYNLPKENFKMKLNEFFRKFIIKRFGALTMQVEGEVELARKWYGARGEYKYSFLYLSNVYRGVDKNVEKDLDKKYIMIGNSADPTNNHKEVFEKLKSYRNSNIEIICPLSYGGTDGYREKVINYGKNIFNEKFVPITDFIEINKYWELLNKIDIGIFNHKRQQALGNITALLGLGKKVFIRSDITTWGFCEKHKLKVYDITSENIDLLGKISEEDIENNSNIVKSEFTEKKLKEDMEKIFE